MEIRYFPPLALYNVTYTTGGRHEKFGIATLVMLPSFLALGIIQTSLASALVAPELDIALGLSSVWPLRSLLQLFDLYAHFTKRLNSDLCKITFFRWNKTEQEYCFFSLAFQKTRKRHLKTSKKRETPPFHQ